MQIESVLLARAFVEADGEGHVMLLLQIISVILGHVGEVKK